MYKEQEKNLQDLGQITNLHLAIQRYKILKKRLGKLQDIAVPTTQGGFVASRSDESHGWKPSIQERHVIRLSTLREDIERLSEGTGLTTRRVCQLLEAMCNVQLSWRESVIIDKVYGKGWGDERIAERLGCTEKTFWRLRGTLANRVDVALRHVTAANKRDARD